MTKLAGHPPLALVNHGFGASVSQSYYGGQSRIDTSTIIVTPATNATIIDQQSITGTDQSSAVVTSVDANARSAPVTGRPAAFGATPGEPAERRRQPQPAPPLPTPTSAIRRIVMASVLAVKVQGGAGVLYRFDGLSASYNFSPHVK